MKPMFGLAKLDTTQRTFAPEARKSQMSCATGFLLDRLSGYRLFLPSKKTNGAKNYCFSFSHQLNGRTKMITSPDFAEAVALPQVFAVTIPC